MLKKTILLMSVLVLSYFPAQGAEKMAELQTVDSVDLSRYMGVWYEIARFTHRFEKGLVGVTATYELLKNGKVSVLNAGLKDTLDGELKTAKGKAVVADKNTNAKLKVSFFWPFYGNYWIIELGKDYEYAVVGEPKRKYLWILSRTPKMDAAVYDGIIERLKAKGYDTSKLDLIPQK